MAGYESWNQDWALAVIAEQVAPDGAALPILHALQAVFGCVPQQAEPIVAPALNLSQAEVHGVVTFYHDFRRAPPARHVLRVCRAEDRLEIHPHDAEERGVKGGDWVRLRSRAGETTLRAQLIERVSPGVVHTTFHHPLTQANVVTTDYPDWATNCPEHKVTAVQASPSNGASEWQVAYQARSADSRRVEAVPAHLRQVEAAPADGRRVEAVPAGD